MRTVINYKLRFDEDAKINILYDIDIQYCHKCYQPLIKNGTRKRKYLDEKLKPHTLLIIRLFCKTCKNYHDVLPSFLIPYKRYHVDTVERCGLDSSDPKPSNLEPCTGPDNDSDGVDALEITAVHRIKRWLVKLIAALPALITMRQARYRLPGDVPVVSSDDIDKSPGWLARIVHDLAFHGLWPPAKLA
jgi:RNase P subunit RPR2